MAVSRARPTTIDGAALRADFPVFDRLTSTGSRLAYLDSAASSQKPRDVIDAVADTYAHHYANVHRGLYVLSADADARYEAARVAVAAFSGHKMLGPSGIGVLWGRRELLDEMPPFLTGGSMITRVTLDGAEWNEVPWKFEAGTPAIAEASGLAAAIAYLERLGMEAVRAHERELFELAWRALGEIPGVRRLGPDSADEHAGVISFVVAGIHPHDVATVLDGHGIAVRAGHHCAQPLMHRYDVPATTRASFYVYNDAEDVGRLVDGIRSAQGLFGTA